MPVRVLVSPDGRQLTCLECGTVTRVPLDVAQRYCPRCRRWLAEEDRTWD